MVNKHLSRLKQNLEALDNEIIANWDIINKANELSVLLEALIENDECFCVMSLDEFELILNGK